MSFNPITVGEIASGEPVSSQTADKIRENFDNHESRLIGVENGTTTVYPPIIMRVNGYYSSSVVQQDIVRTTCNFNLSVTGVFLVCETAGVSGTTEIDIEFKRGAGAWTSVLTTKPSVSYSAGDNAMSSNAVVNPTYADLEAGDFIRLNITSSQSEKTKGLLVRIDFNKS